MKRPCNSCLTSGMYGFLRCLLLTFAAEALLLVAWPSYAQDCRSNGIICTNVGASCTVGGAEGTCRQLSDECDCWNIHAYSVGVNVSGMASGTLQLDDNGGNTLSISRNGSFTFPGFVEKGSRAEVTIQSQPTGQICKLGSNSNGIVSASVIVLVTCTSDEFTIGVTVSGLTNGTLTLLDNGGNPLLISANGFHQFTQHVLTGNRYSLSIQSQPTGQMCAFGTSSSGPVNDANVNIPVTCLGFSTWTPIGPAPVANPGPGSGGNAGRVNVAAADPLNSSVIYVGAAGGGIWKTTNATAGTTPVWQPLTDMISAPLAAPSNLASLQVGGSPHSLSIHPANHNLIQAVVDYSGAGVLLSNQAGAPGTWSLMGNSQAGQTLFDHLGISSIAVHPTDQQIAYVTTSNGLYQTTNGGQTWTVVGGGLPTSGVYDVIYARFDPSGNTIFVTVEGNSGSSANLNGVYRSTNGGSSWTLLTGLPNSALSSPNGATGAIQVDSGSKQALYVSMLTVGPVPPAQSCGNSPLPPCQVNAVQRFVSSDQGNTWEPLAPSPGNLENRSWHQLIAVDPQNDTHVLVNDSYRLYESYNAGLQQWTWADPPLQNGIGLGYDWASVSFDANGCVLATADQGPFRYTPYGTTTCQTPQTPPGTWESLIGNLQITTFYTNTIDEQAIAGTAQDQYAAIVDNSGQANAVWEYINSGGETGKVLFPPNGTGYAYVYNPLSDNNNNLVWRTQLTQPTGLQQGTQWTPIFAQNIYGKGKGNYGFAYTSQKAFVMDPYNARRLLVGADQVYETTNADYASPSPTWNPIGPPVPTGERYVVALVIAPSATNYVYVSTSDEHLWLTTDDGSSWAECDSGLYNPRQFGPVYGINVDPNNPQHVLVVSSQSWGTSKVWELGSASTFGADPCQASWVNRSGPNNLTVYAIVADWRYSTPRMYIGTDRGVFYSADDGATWKPFGSGLPNAQVYDLQSAPWSASSTANLLVAATYGRGAFETLLPLPAPPAGAPPQRRVVGPPAGPVPAWVPPTRPPWASGQQQTPPRQPPPR